MEKKKRRNRIAWSPNPRTPSLVITLPKVDWISKQDQFTMEIPIPGTVIYTKISPKEEQEEAEKELSTQEKN